MWYNGGVTTPVHARDYDVALSKRQILLMLIRWASDAARSSVVHHDVWPVASIFRLKRVDLTNEN